MSFLIYLILICLIISCVINNRKIVILFKSIGWWLKSSFLAILMMTVENIRTTSQWQLLKSNENY